MKDYYLILGVDSEASLDEIKAAYRRQAKDLHPDYYGQDSGPFIDLQEAYAVLSDAARRRVYDREIGLAERRGRSAGIRPEPLIPRESKPEPLIPREMPADLGDLSLNRSFRTIRPSFEELFDRIWRNFSLDWWELEPLQSLNVEIRLSRKDALRGGRVRLLVPARLECPTCAGRGGVDYYRCWKCGGDGVIQGEYPVTLTYPAGVTNSHHVQLPLDSFGIHDLYLNIIFRVGER
ncbi:MAG TPA: DnaJ domain-containing protein [Anaerolineae bacterium]|nr:DnaJ domain-containing protein [Anaerolineae bacterium]